MPPSLPYSLSPHICILPSKDLEDLLRAASLPPLHDVLESFSPLPNITTRTTTLSTVQHSKFTLRFSDLSEIEAACKEDEEQRAGRFIDWISARVNQKCQRWVEDVERRESEVGQPGSTSIADIPEPWWEEMKRCAEGDHVPSKSEGWNYPTSIIIAVSTNTANPLNALANLHARPVDLPAWADGVHLRYTLVVHSDQSLLNDDEANALYNAVKKQYGLNTYFLRLTLPSPLPPPVSIAPLYPRLPMAPYQDGLQSGRENPASPSLMASKSNEQSNSIPMCGFDIQAIAQFVRDFVTTTLIPWMERCVMEWNETFSSNRRLPSRLFSTTRRLFGSSSPSPSSPTAPSYPYGGTGNSYSNGPTSPIQQRRLAEFSTMLGDYKLAMDVWEALRKESKGSIGSDILPLLLSPSQALQLHALNALSFQIAGSNASSAKAQIRSMIYAVRWELGISTADFLSDNLEGDRWLACAAGKAEETPAALLFAHSAVLSSRKRCKRRAAVLYVMAARRLEKIGIRPLTLYFLRRAHNFFTHPPVKSLSPLFDDAENRPSEQEGSFDAIIPSVEHSIGRLMYTVGETESAIRLFLGLLRGSHSAAYDVSLNDEYLLQDPPDKAFLEDFRLAFEHFVATNGQDDILNDLRLPFRFFRPKSVKIRLRDEHQVEDNATWEEREEQWRDFWRGKGKQRLKSGESAFAGEFLWVDITLCNPLNVALTLTNLTLVVEDATNKSISTSDLEVEVIDEIYLNAKEQRQVSLSIMARRPCSLVVREVSYSFLGLLNASESLAVRGRRLHETAYQRQNKIYAPDVYPSVEVDGREQRLEASFTDDQPPILGRGEVIGVSLRIENVGTRTVGEVWLVHGPEDEIWIEKDEGEPNIDAETIVSTNSLCPPAPVRLPFHALLRKDMLDASKAAEIPLKLRAADSGRLDMYLMFVFRETGADDFRGLYVKRSFYVKPLLDVSVTAKPAGRLDFLYTVDMEVRNLSTSTDANIAGISAISPTWNCTTLNRAPCGPLPAGQTKQILFGASKREDGLSSALDTLRFVTSKFADVLEGRELSSSEPPSIELRCSQFYTEDYNSLLASPHMKNLLHASKRRIVSQSVRTNHPYLPSSLHPYIFPLYNPSTMDIVMFWSILSSGRSGYIYVSGLILGATHAPLRDVIQASEQRKAKRSMFAETRREREEVLETIRNSEWNRETNPLVVFLRCEEVIVHDFSKGPCTVTLTFDLRNYSLTHDVRFLLKLPSADNYSATALLPPAFFGRMIRRGRLAHSSHTNIDLKMWVTQPGAYSTSGWAVETEVIERQHPSVNHFVAEPQVRHRYLEKPSPQSTASVTVIHRS